MKHGLMNSDHKTERTGGLHATDFAHSSELLACAHRDSHAVSPSTSIVSRLLNTLEAAPGWNKFLLVLDILWLRYHSSKHGSRESAAVLAEKLEGRSGLVLIVCKGNICRSPFLAGYLNDRLPKGLVSFKSAGLRGQEETLPPQAAIEIASNFGIDLSTHKARLLRDEDMESADIIIGMEPIHHLEFCMRRFKWRRKFLLLRTLEKAPDSLRVPDPFGQDTGAFHECYALLAKDAEILLSALRKVRKEDAV